jgi:hypothetical protein
MSQQLPEEHPSEKQTVEEEQQEKGYLSGTLVGSLQRAVRGLGAIGSVLFGGALLSILLGGIVWLASSDLRLYGSILLGIGGGLLLMSLVLSWQAVRVTIGARRGRYSINTFTMVLAFLAIAAIGNFLAFQYTSRFDVTATNEFSLSERTKQILNGLDEPVKAWAFFDLENPDLQEVIEIVDNMLMELDARSGKFSYELLDPDRDPDVALDKGYLSNKPIVFEGQDSEILQGITPSLFVSGAGFRTSFLEQDFVTAMLIVTGSEQRTVCFLRNHLEGNISDMETPEGFGVAAFIGLRGENYDPRTLNLLNTPKTRLLANPGECALEDLSKPSTVLVVAGPKQDLFQGEIDILDDYLMRGGLMLILADIDAPESLRIFLQRWGVVVENGYIWDENRSMPEGPRTPLAVDEQYYALLPDPFGLQVQDITASLGITYYPGVSSLSPAEGVAFFPVLKPAEDGENDFPESPTVIATALTITSGDSWLVGDLSRAEPDKEMDRRGPFIPAIALQAAAPVGAELPANPDVAAVVVIGDSDFANNMNFYDPRATNSDFFLNSVNWLAGDVALASIRPKPIGSRDLILNENQRDFVKLSSWILLPAIMAMLGVFAWWKRR